MDLDFSLRTAAIALLTAVAASSLIFFLDGYRDISNGYIVTGSSGRRGPNTTRTFSSGEWDASFSHCAIAGLVCLVSSCSIVLLASKKS